jgi:hypothetical protein
MLLFYHPGLVIEVDLGVLSAIPRGENWVKIMIGAEKRDLSVLLTWQLG